MNSVQFDILTIFPQFFESSLQVSLLGKAITQKKLNVALHNFRDFATDKHKTVDDVPYGGGPGMVLKPEPLVNTIESISGKKKSKCILLTPRGTLFNQKMARQMAKLDQLILICGRYEGVDERVCELVVDEEISIGDYVLNGGEVAALVLLETVARLIPGVLGNEASLSHESFNEGLLEYPQYTRPPELRGLKVPKVLLSGNHKEIEAWRGSQAIKMTKKRRPDLLKKLQNEKKPAKEPT